MADDVGKTDTDDDAVESAGPVAGERLLAARREQKIPILEIAKELHLDEFKVRALERNEFDIIGAPVFAKGHLRKYAQLVGVAEDDVMADYHLLDRRHGAPPEISLRSRPRREMSPVPWLAALVVVLSLASAYWWLAGRKPAVSVVAPTAVPEQPDAEAVTAQPPPADDDAVADEADLEPASNPQADAAVVVPAAADDQEMRVSVTYSGDSWTEITDANGRRLFFNLGSAGDTINLSGEAPFNVLFGNADNVSLSVDDQPYEIGSASRRGRTARLTITKP